MTRKSIEPGTICSYCRIRTAVLFDHIIPSSRGGSDDDDNLRPACVECNSSKSNSTLDEWFAILIFENREFRRRQKAIHTINYGSPSNINVPGDFVFREERRKTKDKNKQP